MSDEQSQRVKAAPALLLAAACGWVVMELEIIGARILQPYFGSSVSVLMGSVIGVFLLSLAVGYQIGGRLSRHRASRLLLGSAVAAAGAWLCVLPWMVEPICDKVFDLVPDDRWGSLVSSLALFAAPTVLLGMVSPTVVRWTTAQAEDSGARAGSVLAISTAASFGGCVVTAFYLVRLSAWVTVRASGGVLLLLGAVTAGTGWLALRRNGGQT